MKRRDAIRAGGSIVASTTLAGCLDTLGFQTQSAWRDPPLPSNRPDAVYYPAIVEEMGMYGMKEVPDEGVTFALMFSYPHRFWTVTGANKQRVVVNSDDSLHLMASLWDTESQTVLPVDISLEVLNDGESVTQRSLWPMLSQTMGFHYGDNFSLPDEGQYTARLSVGPVQARRTGSFESRFENSMETEIDFEFDTTNTYNLDLRRLGGKAGERGAVEPTMEEMPAGRTPMESALPGEIIGADGSGDATFVISYIENASRFGDQSYLAVSPRTPYNRIMLPLMSLSATVVRDGSTVFDDILSETLDPVFGDHYGGTVGQLQSGDTVTVTVDAPPQMSRHDGYETAFFDMPPIEVTV